MKIVGCEFSKYIQLLENRQKKIRRYKQEDIKPLLTVTETNIINEEQIQRNCEQIQQLLEQYPNRKIGVLRITEDICQIKEKGTKKVIFEGTSAETLQELEKIMRTLTEVNKIRILEIANTFPPNTIKVDIKDDWCYFHKTYSDLQYDTVFRISEFGGNTEDSLIRMSKDANEYYQEQIKNNQ